jgi:hypothetical protein
LKDEAIFGYGVGVEFLHSEKNVASRTFRPITLHEKIAHQEPAGAVITMEKRSL